MDSRCSDDFLINALAILSADIFFHPFWLRNTITDPLEASQLASAMTPEVVSLAEQQDWLSACRVCLARAYLLNLSGSQSDALESLRWGDEMARRGSLTAAAIWVSWGASAVCIQAGDYTQAAEHLARLQQDLYCAGQWVLANRMELVRQSLEEWVAARGKSRRGPPSGLDRTELLINQMLCWGSLPAEIEREVIAASENIARAGLFASSGIARGTTAPSPPVPGESHARSFWQTLLMILHGELRLRLVEVRRQTAAPPVHSPPVLAAPHVEEPLPGRLLQPIASTHANRVKNFEADHSPDLLAKALISLALPDQAQLSNAVPAQYVEPLQPVGETESEERAGGEQDAAVEHAPEQMTGSMKASTAQVPLLNVCLLNSFCVRVGGTTVEDWPSGRSRSVFAYLLAHHAHPVPREVLMETFWPEASLDSARNNLNVAVYTLRHTLKALLKTPVILLNAYSAYQINPDMQLLIDSEAFEQHVRDAFSQETSGAVAKAVSAYQKAVHQYQGDFLADMPFESWATLERERLRVLYLEALDRLSMLDFNQGRYKTCIDLCQRILSRDTCREDAHRRLMQCYVRQGQVPLALRQFQFCVEALREELDVPPSPATVLLYEQIKRQEMV